MTKTEARRLFLLLIADLLAEAGHRGFPLICTCFHRSDAEQAEMLAKGASKTPRSQHQDWLAMDFVLVDPGGELRWKHEFKDEYEILGNIWKAMNSLCRWGGDFGRTDTQPGWDAGHFELSKHYAEMSGGTHEENANHGADPR